MAEQDGFSLVEVMVSVFVLTLGVLGVAGMQLTALRTTQQSSFQTAALQLASEMADRMRANNSQMLADDQNLFLRVDYSSNEDRNPATSQDCYSTACNAEELARFDIREWEKRVAKALPGGRAVICLDTAPWDGGNSALAWTCNAGAGASMVIKLGWRAKGRNPDGSMMADAGQSFPPSVALLVKPYVP